MGSNPFEFQYPFKIGQSFKNWQQKVVAKSGAFEFPYSFEIGQAFKNSLQKVENSLFYVRLQLKSVSREPTKIRHNFRKGFVKGLAISTYNSPKQIFLTMPSLNIKIGSMVHFIRCFPYPSWKTDYAKFWGLSQKVILRLSLCRPNLD